MPSQEWNKIDFSEFVKEFNVDILIENAPTIIYSKKDKEHGAKFSLIASFILAGALSFYIILSLVYLSVFFSLIAFITIISIVALAELLFILNYTRSNVIIKPIECWVEIFKCIALNNVFFYCFVYYPIFSGKCHPHKAKDIIYKLYQEEILKSKFDVTQIEVYLKKNFNNPNNCEPIGFCFQYGEGKTFNDENVNRNSWKFFPFDKSLNDNFIVLANWDHQYEWRNDLSNDFGKLTELAPWVIQKWDKFDLKPLSEDFKEKINWHLRFGIKSMPKLNPWKNDLDKQIRGYNNSDACKDLEIINEAIEKIIGKDIKIKRLRDLEGVLLKFKIYFRDLIL